MSIESQDELLIPLLLNRPMWLRVDQLKAHKRQALVELMKTSGRPGHRFTDSVMARSHSDFQERFFEAGITIRSFMIRPGLTS